MYLLLVKCCYNSRKYLRSICFFPVNKYKQNTSFVILYIMNWNPITQLEELNAINEASFLQKVLIFKHSTRCNISSGALNRLERNWNDENDSTKLKPYFLDLISFRAISTEIAQKWGIEHQSPQVLIIENGKCVYSSTHFDIHYDEIIAL